MTIDVWFLLTWASVIATALVAFEFGRLHQQKRATKLIERFHEQQEDEELRELWQAYFDADSYRKARRLLTRIMKLERRV